MLRHINAVPDDKGASGVINNTPAQLNIFTQLFQKVKLY
jgi:hypothetical protein